MGIQRASIILTLTLGASLRLAASPLITPGAGPADNRSNIGTTQVNAVSWTFASAYTGVTISASLTANGQGITGSAFLMNQVGTGTTTANQIATTAFSFAVVPNNTSLSYQVLFSGLTLGPGTYYLVFTSPNDPNVTGIFSAINFQAGMNYTTAPGVTVGTPLFSMAPDPSYGPASVFGTSTLGNRFFSVSGTEVPEPSSVVLIAGGMVAVALRRRFR